MLIRHSSDHCRLHLPLHVIHGLMLNEWISYVLLLQIHLGSDGVFNAINIFIRRIILLLHHGLVLLFPVKIFLVVEHLLASKAILSSIKMKQFLLIIWVYLVQRKVLIVISDKTL